MTTKYDKKTIEYKKYNGECQYCGYPLDNFEWIIYKGKYENYPVHIYCKEQIDYEDNMEL